MMKGLNFDMFDVVSINSDMISESEQKSIGGSWESLKNRESFGKN